MAKRKPISYAGIPAKERGFVKSVRDGFNLVETPQQIWKGLNKTWNKSNAEKQQQEEAAAKAREKDRKNHALESLEPALSKLADARDMAGAIENDKMGYMEYHVLARCTRLMLEEAGKEVEEALRELAIIAKIEHGYFVTRRSTDFTELESGATHG